MSTAWIAFCMMPGIKSCVSTQTRGLYVVRTLQTMIIAPRMFSTFRKAGTHIPAYCTR